MSDNQKEQGAPFQIHDQYIKDLSIENPNHLKKYTAENQEAQQLAVNVETNVAKIDDQHYEVVLNVRVSSEDESKATFVLELVYGTLISVPKEIDPAALETVLLVHCPFIMFPFVREIVARVTTSGGYPPLMLDPVDFAALYIARRKEAEQQATKAPN